MDYLERMIRGINYIEANLATALDLHAISSEDCLSAYHFHRIFTALTGETPGDYIRSRKLTKVSILLAESDMRILEIIKIQLKYRMIFIIK